MHLHQQMPKETGTERYKAMDTDTTWEQVAIKTLVGGITATGESFEKMNVGNGRVFPRCIACMLQAITRPTSHDGKLPDYSDPGYDGVGVIVM